MFAIWKMEQESHSLQRLVKQIVVTTNTAHTDKTSCSDLLKLKINSHFISVCFHAKLSYVFSQHINISCMIITV